MKVLKYIVKRYVDARTWKTNRKIVIFESDDWGTQRTPNKAVLKELLSYDTTLSKDRFTCLDSLASEDDLSYLFETLNSVSDKTNKPCILTANVCVANPDFNKIKESGFREFYFEPFDVTILNNENGRKVLGLWDSGIKNGIFYPQLHGREHVHALGWLNELRAGNQKLLKAFDLDVWGIPYTSSLNNQRRRNLLASLDVYGINGEEAFQNQWIVDASEIFYKKFGYISRSFIPPTYIWHTRMLPAFKRAGVVAIQGLPIHYEPKLASNNLYKKALHITGTKTNNYIYRIARNVFFEPSSQPELDWVDKTMNSIEFSFERNRPAIIGTHRINYIGSLDVNNRDRNLKMLKTLLNRMIQKWPDIEFHSSDSLISLFSN